MNRLIIVEGPPCSGKSTASRYIADRLKARYYDEGSGDHPADWEFHAYIDSEDSGAFSSAELELIRQKAEERVHGLVVPIGGELFEKLLKYKIYDSLPWEKEKPVMLDKWREFAGSVREYEIYVFNCVLLQNPMCETMMRFGFDTQVSFEYISSVCEIIRPLEPFVVYLHCSNIREAVEKAIPERGQDWLDGVIGYHCGGGYGKANRLSGFDGYISALEERQRRETDILRRLGVRYMIVNEPHRNWGKALEEICSELGMRNQLTING